MEILVQKFGGTSVANTQARQRVADKILAAQAAGYSVVAVVSAMGRKGDPYATDTLLGLVSGETDPRELDLLMACGEQISGIVLVDELRRRGRKARFLTGPQAGIITSEDHGEARVLEVDPSRMMLELEQGNLVVVAGFQGMTKEGELTTLGRGGSDTSAVALGIGLGAERVEIYTDVSGIMTADPRIVKGARILKEASYQEVCQMAQQGAKVIHPRAVEMAMGANLPLWIKNTFDDAPGTLITSRSDRRWEYPVAIQGDLQLTGVAHNGPVTQVAVAIPSAKARGKVEAAVFAAMARHGISVDLINVLPGKVLYTVKAQLGEKAREILQEMDLQVELNPACAKVSLVGGNMAGVPGVMARVAAALAAHDIPILQSADSHATIWCLVPCENVEDAVRALHEEFLTPK